MTLEHVFTLVNHLTLASRNAYDIEFLYTSKIDINKKIDHLRRRKKKEIYEKGAEFTLENEFKNQIEML